MRSCEPLCVRNYAFTVENHYKKGSTRYWNEYRFARLLAGKLYWIKTSHDGYNMVYIFYRVSGTYELPWRQTDWNYKKIPLQQIQVWLFRVLSHHYTESSNSIQVWYGFKLPKEKVRRYQEISSITTTMIILTIWEWKIKNRNKRCVGEEQCMNHSHIEEGDFHKKNETTKDNEKRMYKREEHCRSFKI